MRCLQVSAKLPPHKTGIMLTVRLGSKASTDDDPCCKVSLGGNLLHNRGLEPNTGGIGYAVLGLYHASLAVPARKLNPLNHPSHQTLPVW